jgi:hypothetical protein
MSVLLDLIDGHDAELTVSGWTCTRQAIIRGVAGTGAAKIYNAALNTEGVPAIGTAHPDLPNTWLARIHPKSIEGDVVKLELFYQPLEYYSTEYDIGADSCQVDTNLDKQGNSVEVGYTYPADYVEEKYQNLTDIQGVVYSVYKPEGRIVVTKQAGITLSALMNLINTYENKVNTAGWSLDNAAPAGSWLCTSIRGRRSNTTAMVISYSFLKRPSFLRNGTTYPGWSEQLVYIDPNSGKPPDPNTWTENTMKIIMPYDYIDFDDLHL